ncbi:MAG: hypothetical protein K9H84_07875 [Bacteroidales bacterium]|nr:hypothetical protein [Bacteroidales bacterium]
MKLIKQISLIGLTVVLLSSCAKIYYSPDAKVLANKQQTIAIVPPEVSIAPNKEIDAEAMKEQQKAESLNFQNEIYSWMLKRKMQGKITKEIQEIQTTNAKLLKAGYPENPLTTAELCEVLGVDGIMTSNFGLSKPMSEGAAVALVALAGTWGSTNEVKVTLSISDCENKKLIWNYEHKLSGGIGSSPSKIVDQLMRKASRKMPYVK